MPRLCVIYNPVAGEGKTQRVLTRFLEFLSQKYQPHEITLQTTEGKNHATVLAERAYTQGHREFVCIGGDGTFNEMCQPLVGRKNIRVSLVPSGTGNDLAIGLGFSHTFHPKEWENFFRDESVAIDVGQCNERYFFNTMGIGFDALVASEFRVWKWVPRKWRYYPPIFKNLLFYHGYDIILDKTPQKIFLLSIGNGKSSGGGIALTPSAIITDGLLDLCWIENVGIPKRIKNLFLTLKGRHTTLPFVHETRFSTLTLSSSQPCVTHIDGEIFYLNTWHVSLQPSSLLMYINQERATLIGGSL
ncbi:MAG: YegS/Rv2252/BmrU family lipid kinase [Brevinematales bacterium]|nr:YegS/Rv2252/BmrU family lipid kinase [Brevinematales bacterium]